MVLVVFVCRVGREGINLYYDEWVSVCLTPLLLHACLVFPLALEMKGKAGCYTTIFFYLLDYELSQFDCRFLSLSEFVTANGQTGRGQHKKCLGCEGVGFSFGFKLFALPRREIGLTFLGFCWVPDFA